VDGQPVYIIDPDIQEGYEISEKVQLYRYQLAEQAGAEIYQGKTLDILAEIHQKMPIVSIITKSTFRPVYQALFQEIKQSHNLELLPDYFLSTDNYLQPAKRFFQYWNKVKKNLRY
jgi:tRNA A37 threonylcarbamoyladenosine modification protein TsaB